jgi:hypothetical protein
MSAPPRQAGSLTPEHRRPPSRSCGRSPPQWAGRRGRSERQHEVIVERIVERAAPAGNFPVLTKTNYYNWAALMHVMLQERGMWNEVTEGESDYTEDRMALEVIAKAVTPELMGLIASKPSVKAAWEAIILRNVGVDRVRKAKASTLKREFDSLTFLDGESIDDFGARIGRITNQLAVLGFEYKEEIVRRFLQALPPRFEQIATSIETLIDLETITVDELIGHLKPSEERINRGGSSAIASLNLTEDELIPKITSRLKIVGGGNTDQQKEVSSSGSKRGRGHGKGARGGGCGGSNAGHGGNTVAGNKCRYCGKSGHWACECKKKKRDEQAHAAQVEDDGEATLLVACASVDIDPVVPATTEVHLKEDKLFVQLDDNTRWILDTGATNHMTGERSTFSEVDTKVHGIVHFGDRSVVRIEGRGTVLLQCKNGEHKALPMVYLIPRLTASIVSLGQLEGGYWI